MKLQNSPSSFPFWSLFLHVTLLYFVSLLQPTSTIANALGNETDRFALLKFKEAISNDPYEVMSSWNDSVHFCKWPGILCSRKHQRTTVLDLQFHNLRGSMSPYIGNLSFLRFIYLGGNSFFGEIPSQIGLLRRLQHLNLTSNMLEGKFPVNLSSCSKLKTLGLFHNKLTGVIPLELGSLVKLVELYISANNLRGIIPASLGNISSLREFYVAENNLEGTIPYELGRLKRLTIFSIGVNNLSGEIPRSIYNISSISSFAITNNHFKGTLPPNIGLTLPNLQEFGIGGNEFSGIIPGSFANASRLRLFDIDGNNFFGQVPACLGNLPNLQMLNLCENTLGNYSANSLGFIRSLTNCSQLETLCLAKNNFRGVLPSSIANLSTQLTMLFLDFNDISGNFPTTLENLVNLIALTMSYNQFTNVIPASIGKLQNLQALDLGNNRLSGKIPSSIGNLSRMFYIYLGNNRLEGTLPPNFANLQNLQYLDISNNSLGGAIPKGVLSLFSPIEFNFSWNLFTGSLPAEVGKLKNINKLDLSENNLTNEIPETIGDCQTLEFLLLQGNFFQGIMPSAVASLRGLQYLDVSRNNLTGEIPLGLQNLPLLTRLNLSFNNLEGEVPKKGIFQNTSAVSFVGNTKLCGGLQKLQLPPCPIKASEQQKTRGLKLTIIIVSVVAIFLLFKVFIVFYWRRKSTRESTTKLSDISFLSKVSYKRVYQATDGFSPSMLIGTGSFGSVYKGILEQEENVVAVKVLNLHEKGASKSFISECNALRTIRHRNLVKIWTCCSSMDYKGNEFKALVFEYLSNGSLDKWLHSTEDGINHQSRGLNVIQRLNIALDVASAIYYLHDLCAQPIIHCDLKPSNVLLDNEMIGHVSDFGLARLISDTNGLSEGRSSTIGVKGTIGYTPPEYTIGGQPSKEGDVYSYGILVLEMFTRRRPTDEMFKDDFNLRNFVKMALPERLAQIVDSSLLPREVEENALRTSRDGRNYDNKRGIEIVIEEENINFENQNQISPCLQKCLVSVLEIGLACSEESPNERINMGDVTRKLQHIRNAYMDVGIHGQR